jgi:hypothetical protein
MMSRYWDYRGRRFVAIIGSREAPVDVISLLEATGQCLCDLGIAVSSGDADGCDKAGVRGAMRSSSWPLVGARVFLPSHKVTYPNGFTRYADNYIYYDASQFPNIEEARAMAFRARGSFHGLYEKGIALHSRNSYQILLDDLKTPVASVVFYAQPVGKKGLVSGGTNTAVQIARLHNIPLINLATDEGMVKIQKFLERKGKRT